MLDNLAEDNSTSTMLQEVLLMRSVTRVFKYPNPFCHDAYCPWIYGHLFYFVFELSFSSLDTIYLSLYFFELISQEYLVYLSMSEELEEGCSLDMESIEAHDSIHRIIDTIFVTFLDCLEFFVRLLYIFMIFFLEPSFLIEWEVSFLADLLDALYHSEEEEYPRFDMTDTIYRRELIDMESFDEGNYGSSLDKGREDNTPDCECEDK